jgi:hypothetical protein
LPDRGSESPKLQFPDRRRNVKRASENDRFTLKEPNEPIQLIRMHIDL